MPLVFYLLICLIVDLYTAGFFSVGILLRRRASGLEEMKGMYNLK